MAGHELTASQQDTLVVGPAAKSHALLDGEILDGVEDILLAGSNVSEELAHDTSGVGSKACCLQKSLVDLCVGEDLDTAQLHRSFGEEGVGVHQHAVAVVEVVNALIAQHDTLVFEGLARDLLQRDIHHKWHCYAA